MNALRQGKRVAIWATFVNAFMAVMKAVVGFMFASPILIADAFHSGADIFLNFASSFGLWLASREKSDRFPYGLYKAETIACLIIGFSMTFAGFEIFKEGYGKVFTLTQYKGFPIFPIGATLISSFLSLLIALKMRKIGLLISSHSLIANAQEAFLDIFVSLVVMMGILLGFLNIPYVEGIIIMLIALLIVKLGVSNIWISLLILLDSNLDPDLQDEIEEKINQTYGVLGVSDVKIRQSGPFQLVECSIKIKHTIPLYRAHELATGIEDQIHREYERIESIFIHIEPIKEKALYAIVPIEAFDDTRSIISKHFSRASCYALIRCADTCQLEDVFFNEHLDQSKHIGVNVVKTLIQYKIDMVFAVQMGEIAFSMLKNNFVDIYQVSKDSSLMDIIDSYHSNKLQPMNSATHSVDDSLVNKSPTNMSVRS